MVPRVDVIMGRSYGELQDKYQPEGLKTEFAKLTFEELQVVEAKHTDPDVRQFATAELLKPDRQREQTYQQNSQRLSAYSIEGLKAYWQVPTPGTTDKHIARTLWEEKALVELEKFDTPELEQLLEAPNELLQTKFSEDIVSAVLGSRLDRSENSAMLPKP